MGACSSASRIHPESAATFDIGTLISPTALKHLIKPDEKVIAALAAGHVKIVSAAFLRSRPPGWKIRRRQELEALESEDGQVFLPADEAVRLMRGCTRRILVLSYGWLSAEYPDVGGHRMAAVRAFLERHPSIAGLFWDYASAPQNPFWKAGLPAGARSEADQGIFGQALPVMTGLCAPRPRRPRAHRRAPPCPAPPPAPTR